MENKSSSKTAKEIWSDFIRDIIGFDRGYYFTLKALYLTPQEVFESYINKKGKYLSPFTLLGISFSIYYLISGFLVDWTLVGDSVKHAYRAMLVWEVNLISGASKDAEVAVSKVHNYMIVPMVDFFIACFSKYLIVVALPVQIIMLQAISIFARKIGYGFYQLFVTINYYFSFALLYADATIVVSLISIWLLIPCSIAYIYFFSGRLFKSFRENERLMKKAFAKGIFVGTIFLLLLGSLIGIIWGSMLR